jgi:FMN phosphatase YigB (HAD superfamily)
MIKALVSDFSKVLLVSADDTYSGKLNDLHKKLQESGEYDFWSHFRLNQDLLVYYGSLQDQITIYVFTSKYIQEDLAVKPILDKVFTEVFSGIRLGLKKTEPRSYAIIASKIGLKPNEVIYVDDKQANLDAAKEIGMQTILFADNATLKKEVSRLLEKFTE